MPEGLPVPPPQLPSILGEKIVIEVQGKATITPVGGSNAVVVKKD